MKEFFTIEGKINTEYKSEKMYRVLHSGNEYEIEIRDRKSLYYYMLISNIKTLYICVDKKNFEINMVDDPFDHAEIATEFCNIGGANY